MAWIESHQELARHPKTARFARQLGVSKPCAIGYLHLFWWWCMDYARDGDLRGFTADEIADGAMWDGEPSHFFECLQTSGFVDGETVHDWHEYGGKVLQRRQADAERKRAGRQSDASKTSAGHPPDIQRMSDVDNTTQQKTREQTQQDNGGRVVSADGEAGILLDEKHTRQFAKDAGYTESEIDEAFRVMAKRRTPPMNRHSYIMGILPNLRIESAADGHPAVSDWKPRKVT